MNRSDIHRRVSLATWLPRLVILAIGVMTIPLAGCKTTTDEISKVDGRGTTTLSEPMPGEPTAQPREPVPGDRISENWAPADRVFFDYDKSEVKPEAIPMLRPAVGWLQERPKAQILIEGHADERGTREYNLALGARRAEALRLVLLSLGLPQNQIAGTVSYGKERPAVAGSDMVAWAQNRRAVMVVQ